MPAAPARTRDLRAIHATVRKLGLDDAAYRTMLREVAGAESAAQLDQGGRTKVLRHLAELERKHRIRTKVLSPRTRDKDPGTHVPVDKIRALWIDMHKAGIVKNGSEEALLAFIRRLCPTVQRIEWLLAAQAKTVIEALKQWRKRAEAKENPAHE